MKIENNLEKCPLCNSSISEIDSYYNNDFPIIKKSYITEILDRTMLFIAIAVSVISVFVNTFLGSEAPWSIVVVIGVFYLFFSAKVMLKKNRNYGLFILLQVFLINIILWVIDMIFGHKGWSVDYAIPFIIIGGSIAISVLSFIRPFRYREYIIYLFIIALLGVAPLIFILTGWCRVVWTNGACVVYSALVVIGMMIFTGRKFNSELKKRLHF